MQTYPDIFESVTFSFRIQKFPRPLVLVFKSNLPVHAHPTRFSDTLRYAGLLWGRRRLRKRHLKSEFVLLRTFISLIPTRSSSNVGKFFWELNFKRLYQSSGKEREGRCLVFTCLTQREIRHFHVVVVQQRQRNLQKRVMPLQSCCLNSYFFERLSHLFRLVHRQMLANFFGVEF